MELNGQISKGQNFLITGIQVEIYPGQTIANAALTAFSDDVYDVLNSGVLILRIGAKDFVRQGNLLKFPPVNRLVVDASTGVAASSIQYASGAGREYAIADILLTSNQNFSVELRNLAALPSTVAGKVGVTLNGYLMRNAQ
jgi:hypothetical protein